MYLQGIDSAEIIETVHARRAPMVPVHVNAQPLNARERSSRRVSHKWLRFEPRAEVMRDAQGRLRGQRACGARNRRGRMISLNAAFHM